MTAVFTYLGLADLQFRDKLERTLLTERLEQRKSTFVLKALQQKSHNLQHQS